MDTRKIIADDTEMSQIQWTLIQRKAVNPYYSYARIAASPASASFSSNANISSYIQPTNDNIKLGQLIQILDMIESAQKPLSSKFQTLKLRTTIEG